LNTDVKDFPRGACSFFSFSRARTQVKIAESCGKAASQS
jgi:hypothetical protein